MAENKLLKPKCSWNVADSNEILDCNQVTWLQPRRKVTSQQVISPQIW